MLSTFLIEWTPVPHYMTMYGISIALVGGPENIKMAEMGKNEN